MTRIWIDGIDYEAKDGETVIQVARRHGLTSIPSLCHHPALKVEAACRMCVVELDGAKPSLVTACTQPALHGLRLRTDTAAVRLARQNMLDLIAGKSCRMCGLCVNACALLGIEAIQFIKKGSRRQVALILDSGQSACIGCLSCERLCASQDSAPNPAAGISGLGSWLSRLAPAVCSACGSAYATLASVAYVLERVPSARARIGLCPACKREASLPTRLRGRGDHGVLPAGPPDQPDCDIAE